MTVDILVDAGIAAVEKAERELVVGQGTEQVVDMDMENDMTLLLEQHFGVRTIVGYEGLAIDNILPGRNCKAC